MAFDPYKEIARDMHKKMMKILSPPPSICIINNKAEILYIDENLKDRLEYIQEYVKTNFNLIEEGQYSFPISGTLLGFFKMSSQLMFVLYSEAGESAKIGKLLLFRGLLENFHQVIEELNEDLGLITELEKSANLVIKLKKSPAVGGPTYMEKIPAVGTKTTTSGRIEIGGPLGTTTTPPIAAPAKPTPTVAKTGMYPELLEKYRNKKFNFMEGIILQYCDGKTSLDDVVTKSKYSKQEVLEVLDNFEKKGWIIIHKRPGGKTFDRLVEVVSKPSQEESVSQPPSIESTIKEVTPEVAPKIYPVLLEKYRNKKFNFKEGIVLQYCLGKLTLEEIIQKCNFPEEEVLEIINHYQKKDWLIIRT
ncbi:MAG: hypothetical protein ACTSRS_04900 [Candidatus Helarchaeota archaeon]